MVPDDSEVEYEPSVLGELAHLVLKFVGFAIALAVVLAWWVALP